MRQHMSQTEDLWHGRGRGNGSLGDMEEDVVWRGGVGGQGERGLSSRVVKEGQRDEMSAKDEDRGVSSVVSPASSEESLGSSFAASR